VDEDVPLEQALKKPEPSQNPSQVEILVNTNQSFETKPVVVPSDRVQEAARQFASAQSFLGYAQPKAAAKSPMNEAPMASQEVEELHEQLQQIMAQMASVQAALSAKRPAINSEVQVSEKENPPQAVKPWSVH
jgi:capsule polysaccharide export protein KpsE/RkpR